MAGVHQKSTVGYTRNISFEQTPLLFLRKVQLVILVIFPLNKLLCYFFIRLYRYFFDRMFHTFLIFFCIA